MVPRGSAFSFNVSKEFGFVDGQTHSIDIYIETANITVDSNPKQLSPGTGELVDFAATQTNSSRTYAAGNSSIYAIMACDNSEVGNFYFQEDCNRLMFFNNDSKFIGSASYLWMLRSSILSDNSTSSLTLYESYIADLYAQVFFYSPKNVDFNFDKYSVGWQNESVFLNVTDRFAAEIRFAKLNPNYQKCIQYVSFRDKNNSRLYVYSGVQEILNTDNMPTDNLVYVIYPNETIALPINYPLTESIYTFVAVNGSVDYRIDNNFTASFDSSSSPSVFTTHSTKIESTTKFSSTNSSSFMLFIVIYLVKTLHDTF
ncbi:hypothetical protein WR25_26354 [Diploscapter pachys]|uniref:CUB-like domain-containing protein n=1 Tax=Diploscapter pachys TaxID=2018661 RepID=A0A2A2JJE0_9BILA|nr:hypothetical protein WR25_26354 [Diploscapter pachys]